MLIQCDNYVKKTYPNGACLIKNGAFLPFKRIGGGKAGGSVYVYIFRPRIFFEIRNDCYRLRLQPVE